MYQVKGNEKVLICPLGWGLGHATRVVPIIEYLLQKGCRVLIAADEHCVELLRGRFPDLEFIIFPSVRIVFGKGIFQLFALFRIAVRMISLTFRDRLRVEKLVCRNQIDLIFSDNRYGLYSKQIPSILITHQLRILFPKPFRWLEIIGEWYVRNHAERFAQCWIPDNTNGFRLSGVLSKPVKMPNNVHFIGLLSRFYGKDLTPSSEEWDLVGIASGPPPFRKELVDELIRFSQRNNLKALVVRGLPQLHGNETVEGNVTLVNHLNDKKMVSAILGTKYLVCRSGYSTIMDLIALGKTALLIPTPGQTEQEYLAKHVSYSNAFNQIPQKQLMSLNMCDIPLCNPTIPSNHFDFFPA